MCLATITRKLPLKSQMEMSVSQTIPDLELTTERMFLQPSSQPTTKFLAKMPTTWVSYICRIKRKLNFAFLGSSLRLGSPTPSFRLHKAGWVRACCRKVFRLLTRSWTNFGQLSRSLDNYLQKRSVNSSKQRRYKKQTTYVVSPAWSLHFKPYKFCFGIQPFLRSLWTRSQKLTSSRCNQVESCYSWPHYGHNTSDYSHSGIQRFYP